MPVRVHARRRQVGELIGLRDMVGIVALPLRRFYATMITASDGVVLKFPDTPSSLRDDDNARFRRMALEVVTAICRERRWIAVERLRPALSDLVTSYISFMVPA